MTSSPFSFPVDCSGATSQAEKDRLETTGQDTLQTPLKVDVAIVGGGIVGLTLATALRSANLTVAIIEAQTPEQAASRQRAYAMSLTSGDIFKGLGLWSEISPQITHFQQVRLSDADYPKVVAFSPQDSGTDAVYYAAEHQVLMTALQRAVDQAPNIHYLSQATVVSIDRTRFLTQGANVPWPVGRKPGQPESDPNQEPHSPVFETIPATRDPLPALNHIQLSTGSGSLRIQAPLLVAADGARSQLRQHANIDTFGWKYWQSCITTVLQPEKSHQNIAYERFWPSGPFAILPLPENRCQIVWTAPHAEAQALLDLPEKEFLQELHRRYGSQMGRLTLLRKPLMFPVQLMQCDRYVQPGLALVGDAAHCCHPVGGQGLNMGIRDAAALAEVLQIAVKNGENIEDLRVLKRYERWRRRENWVILSFTDLLTRIFSNRVLPLLGLRRSGLWILQHCPPLKRLALNIMTGRFGRIPEVATSTGWQK